MITRNSISIMVHRDLPLISVTAYMLYAMLLTIMTQLHGAVLLHLAMLYYTLTGTLLITLP